MKKSLIYPAIAIFVFSCQSAPVSSEDDLQTEAAPSGIKGVWESGDYNYTYGDSTSTYKLQPGLLIYTDGHYSAAFVNGQEARTLMADDATRASITDEEMRAIFTPYTSNSGSYEVSGDSLFTTPSVALWPNFMEGGSAQYKITVDEENLTFIIRDDSVKFTVTYSRLE